MVKFIHEYYKDKLTNYFYCNLLLKSGAISVYKNLTEDIIDYYSTISCNRCKFILEDGGNKYYYKDNIYLLDVGDIKEKFKKMLIEEELTN